MAYIDPKTDFKDGEVLHGIDLNASNEVIKAGVDDNFNRIQDLYENKQDVINEFNKLNYDFMFNTPYIPINISDLNNDAGYITSDYHDNTKQDVINSNNKLDYSLIANTPTIPSKTSDLTNDSGFVDSTYHDNTKQDSLVSGTNIKTINNQNILGSGNIDVGGGSSTWGSISGTLENQEDLWEALLMLYNGLNSKQNLLVSGTNIKTINGQSILGSGNLVVGGGSGGSAEWGSIGGTLSAQTDLYDVLVSMYNGLNGKQEELVSGTNIKTINGQSLLGSGNLAITVPTKLSDLTNDNNTVTDANYVHTDNNYTSIEKTKLAGIEEGAQKIVQQGNAPLNPSENDLWIDTNNANTIKRYNGSSWEIVSYTGHEPIGAISLYAGVVAPEGYLFCDGSNISRTLYSDLFEVIGTTYGSGDGSTTFKIPDFRGRVPVGKDGSDTDFVDVGKTGGSKNLQQHTHNLTASVYGNVGAYGYAGINTITTNDNYLAQRTGTTSSAGTGNSGNLQPYLTINYIIRATKTTPVSAEVVNEYSESTKNAYSSDYINNTFRGILLWRNPNVNSQFAPQDINLPNEDYDCYIIKARVNTTDTNTITFFLYKDGIVVANYSFYYNQTLYVRSRAFIHTQTSSVNKIEVQSGDNVGNTNNGVIIPYEIIAYRNSTKIAPNALQASSLLSGTTEEKSEDI